MTRKSVIRELEWVKLEVLQGLQKSKMSVLEKCFNFKVVIDVKTTKNFFKKLQKKSLFFC